MPGSAMRAFSPGIRLRGGEFRRACGAQGKVTSDEGAGRPRGGRGRGRRERGGAGGGRRNGVLANLLARGEKGDFPMIGKKVSNGWKICAVFSNGWKTFFQWLENLGRFFQRLEKFFGGFPMIGKSFWRQLGQPGTTLSRCAAQPVRRRMS